MKKTLNEEVSRIKGMMGLNEGQKHSYTENFGGNFSKEDDPIVSGDIEWEDPSDRQLALAHKDNADKIKVYGSTWEPENEVGTTHYVGLAPIIYDGAQLYADLENVSDIKIDDSWEPSDDQIMNQGNYEGGISYGSGDQWQGR
jgi:hypothetical protein